MLISLVGCSSEFWSIDLITESEKTYVQLISPNGDIYKSIDIYSGYYISGIQKGNYLGKTDSESEQTNKVYSIKDAPEGYLVIYYLDSTREKYFPKVSLEGPPDCFIYVKDNLECIFDYKSDDVNALSYVPYEDIPQDEIFDYKEYVSKNGKYNEDAQTILRGIISEASQDTLTTNSDEGFDLYIDSQRLGRLVFYPSDMNWFCYDGEIIYHPERGYYLSINLFSKYELYPIADDIAELLGINS